MENKRGFEVKYHGATNTKGARVSILDLRNNKRKYISFDYEMTGVYNMAANYLESIGIEVVAMCETSKGYILISDNFDCELI